MKETTWAQAMVAVTLIIAICYTLMRIKGVAPF